VIDAGGVERPAWRDDRRAQGFLFDRRGATPSRFGAGAPALDSLAPRGATAILAGGEARPPGQARGIGGVSARRARFVNAKRKSASEP
jgi:hypothetical protein